MRTICCLLLVLVWVNVTEAARTVYSEGMILVKLEIGQPTAVILPEEVSTVTTAMPESRLMIDKPPGGSSVGFVLGDPDMPRNRQIITGLSGKVYMVYVEVAQPGRSDDMVYVTHKAPAQADILSPVSVIRTLRSAKGPGPAQPLTLPLPTTQDPRVMLSKPSQYTMGPYQALVLTIENTQDVLLQIDERVGEPTTETPLDRGPGQALTVALQSWIWPPGRRLSAVAVEQTFIEPRGSTTLYAIFEER